MAIVYFGLGSNREPESNLRLGLQELGQRFDLRAISSVYRNRAVGFEGEDFLNAVACVETDRSPEEVCRILDEIHDVAGRSRNSERFVSRTLDIDLLLYDQLAIADPPVRLPRSDVLEYSFVLRPLAEIAPDYVHPVSGRTLAEHWTEFDTDSHPLSLVPMEW